MIARADILEQVLAAGFQVVIVSICIVMFLYVRLAVGPRARYMGHLAGGWGFIGIVYAFYGAVVAWSSAPPVGPSKDLWSIISSTISMVSSAFLFASWYMMRDERAEEKAGARDPLPTMSRPFVAGLLLALNAGVAAYIGMITKLIPDPDTARNLFSVLDVGIACTAYIMVGSELLRMRLTSDPNEGTLFPVKWAHPLFRWVTFLLFVCWGAMQFWVPIGLWGVDSVDETPAILRFPHGTFYTWLALMKLLCATTASILVIHALPNVRWKHRPVS